MRKRVRNALRNAGLAERVSVSPQPHRCVVIPSVAGNSLKREHNVQRISMTTPLSRFDGGPSRGTIGKAIERRAALCNPNGVRAGSAALEWHRRSNTQLVWGAVRFSRPVELSVLQRPFEDPPYTSSDTPASSPRGGACWRSQLPHKPYTNCVSRRSPWGRGRTDRDQDLDGTLSRGEGTASKDESRVTRRHQVSCTASRDETVRITS